MDEKWFRVLTYWQKHEMKHALTIPFLIGALRKPVGAPFDSENAARSAFEALMGAVRNHHADGYHLYIYRCPDRKQLVLRQVSGSASMKSVYQDVVPIPTSSEGESVLHASDAVPPSSSTPFDDLLRTIWCDCGEAIQLGEFSCRGHNYYQFNDYELKIIRAALA